MRIIKVGRNSGTGHRAAMKVTVQNRYASENNTTTNPRYDDRMRPKSIEEFAMG